jgi:hypothetical protein
MAQLLVAAAVNIAIGLAINALFPPPDVEQEGPRLSDLNFTSAAYGKFINIPFGTDRMGGNIIDTTDPAIEEVVNESSESVGKGGGQDVNTTTYTYFLTARLSFCIEGASDLVQLRGDGKIIYDAVGDGQLVKEGWVVTFYPGGPTQLQDAEEVARRGSDIPAYRHLTTVKLDRCPLADFGNRIPNFTAVIAFDSTVSSPTLFVVEPTGFDPNGSLTGADASRSMIDPTRNAFYELKQVHAINNSDMVFRNFIGGGGFAVWTVGLDGFAYGTTGSNNAGPLTKRDVDTGTTIWTLGGGGITTTDNSTPNYGNSGTWEHLTTTIPGVGVFGTAFHRCSFPNGGPPNGSVTDTDSNPGTYLHTITTADGFASTEEISGNAVGIADHDRGRYFLIQNSATDGSHHVVMYEPNFSIGVGGVIQTVPTITSIGEITHNGAAPAFPTGTSAVSGWALNRNTGEIILNNGSSMILYDPDAHTVSASRTGVPDGFEGRHNYFTGGIFAWCRGSQTPSASSLEVIDTRTLEVIRSISPLTAAVPDFNDNVVLESSQVWDDRVQAINLSRVQLGSDAPVDMRVAKVFVNRILALGVPLSDVVTALSTTYQRQKMAGLRVSDIDVTELAGDTVQGYTLNRKSSMRSALEPLRIRYQFDAIQSDWIMKFPKRGGAPIVTIPEEDVGILKRGRDQTDEPPIQEVRMDDLSLPMSLGIRYKNRNTDYQIDMETFKRHLSPNPTMRSKSDKTIDMPIVDDPVEMKQLAQKQLITTWNERVSYKTVIPWTYINLDPTDVFNLGAFGETARIRMAENDLGQGWAIEMTGVVEDVQQYSSTLAGGANLGHISPGVPSGLPTNLVPMDAPILASEDLLITPIANAYMATRAFDASWPGASTQKSLDNVNFTNTGSVSLEAVYGKVDVVPGAWTFQEGTEFPNRFQEVVDGGTMTVTGLRRTDWWASATELQVLNGWNAIAVMRPSDGAVEVVSFVDVVDNDDGTFTLSRLLRGRLGTEDIADGGMEVGSEVVGLISATGVREVLPITRQRLPLSELDSELFFRAVTIGTNPSDAVPISFTYTGRDLRPYMVADIVAVSDGSGGLDITWQRRARGPQQGEWLDGTGVTPLNEQIEQYIVTLNNGVTDFVSKTVNNTNFVNFTEDEVNSGGGSGGVAKTFWPATQTVSGDFEGGTINTEDAPLSDGGWVSIDPPNEWFWRTSGPGIISGPPVDARITPASTNYLTYEAIGSDPQRTIRNEIDLIQDLGLAASEIPFATIRCSIWAAQPDSDDSVDLWLRSMDADSNILATDSISNVRMNPAQSGVALGEWVNFGSIYDATSDPWPQRDLTLTLDQPGAARLAFDIGINKGGTTFNQGRMAWDHLEVEAVVTPAVTIKIEQVSESGKRSIVAIKNFSN